ncbi:KN57_gp022 [Dikerogammarus haemobaphes nudivirus]|nr:KN57_gp022 [Dikerogammarus haemobaphes nudivirus]
MYHDSQYKFRSCCMFQGVARCSNTFKNHTRVICDLHYSHVLNLATVNDTLIGLGTNGERPHTKTVITQNLNANFEVLPFPFKLVSDKSSSKIDRLVDERFQPDDYTSEGHRLCIDDNISRMVNQYLYSGKLKMLNYTTEQIDTIRDILIYWISGGTIVNHTNNRSANLFTSFYTHCRYGLIQYWKEYYVFINTTHRSGSGLQKFAMSKMPIFYQCILMNVEVSNNIYKNGTATNAIPNLLFDVNCQSIRLVNNGEREVFLHTERSTFATPLILIGSMTLKSNLPYILFTRTPPTDEDNNFVSAPTRCIVKT